MNRHEIYIWEATQADLNKDFNELLGSGADYAEIEQSPSANLLAFAEALNEHRKTVDYSRRFFNDAAYEISTAKTKAIIIEFLEEDDWKRPLRDMVKLAQDYNVIIADAEITMVFLPTGDIEPNGSEEEWAEILGGLAEQDELRDAYADTNLPTTEYNYAVWIRGLLDIELAGYGFKLVKIFDNKNNEVYNSFYCREVELGQQYLKFVHVGSSPYFWSHTSFYMECPAASNIYHKFDFDKQPREVFYAQLPAFTDFDYCSASPLSEHLAKRHINDIINYIIKPIFDNIIDIKGLDNFVNGWLSKQSLGYVETIKNPPIESKPKSEKTFLTPDKYIGMGYYFPQQLIIARLANNPEYDKLKTFFEASRIFSSSQEVHATEWPKLVKYLEEEINPETFWQQYALLKEEEKRLDKDRVQQLITQFKLNPDEELIPVSDQWYDSQTNLIWQRCCMGEHWQDAQLTGKAELMSWDEKEAYLERFKGTGWRLPSFQELITLTLKKPIGYVTKDGFDYYDEVKRSFIMHWITPYNPYDPQLMPDVKLYIVTVSNGGIHSSKEKNDPDFRGYVRLVKSVHKQA